MNLFEQCYTKCRPERGEFYRRIDGGGHHLFHLAYQKVVVDNPIQLPTRKPNGKGTSIYNSTIPEEPYI